MSRFSFSSLNHGQSLKNFPLTKWPHPIIPWEVSRATLAPMSSRDVSPTSSVLGPAHRAPGLTRHPGSSTPPAVTSLWKYEISNKVSHSHHSNQLIGQTSVLPPPRGDCQSPTSHRTCPHLTIMNQSTNLMTKRNRPESVRKFDCMYLFKFYSKGCSFGKEISLDASYKSNGLESAM